MNNIVNLSELITRVGQGDGHRHQHRPPLPARILRHNRRLGLAEGESVSIKNIGTFRCNSDPLSGMSGAVVFIPDNAVSEEVKQNTFSMFEPVRTCRTAQEQPNSTKPKNRRKNPPLKNPF